MNVMHSFTLKSLKRNKKRTIVTIIGVIISAAMITGVATIITSFMSMLQRAEIADGGNWHAVIQNVSVENVPTITDSDIVKHAALSRDIGYTPLTDPDNPNKPFLFLREYNDAGFDQMSIRVKSGRLPQNSHEVIISESIGNSDNINLDIGDTVTLESGQRVNGQGNIIKGNNSLYYNVDDNNERTIGETFIPGETDSTYTIVGIMERPGFEYSWSAGYSILGYLDENELSPSDSVDVYLSVDPLNRNLYPAVASLAEQVGNTKEDVTYHDELLRYYGVVSNDSLNTFMYGFALVLTLIIVLASISLIYNAFAISVTERSKQLGLLSSVGATRRQKRASVYFEGLIIGLIGIPLGILAGIGGIGITLRAIQPLLDGILNVQEDVKLELVVSAFPIIAAVVFSVITIFVSVYIPARRASKIMPIDAIRLTNDVRLTRRTVKTGWLTRKLFGFEAEIALKNLKRSRKKYRATIVSLVISLVLFLTVSTYADMTGYMSGATYGGYNYDINVDYSTTMPASQLDSLERSICSLDGITDYSNAMLTTGTIPLDADQLTEYAKDYNDPSLEDGKYDFMVYLFTMDDESFSQYARSVGISTAEYTDPAKLNAILINHGQGYITQDDGSLIKASDDILTLRPGETVSLTLGDLENTNSDSIPLTIGTVTDERPMGVLMQTFSSPYIVVSKSVFDKIIQSSQVSEDMVMQHMTYLTSDDDQGLEKQISSITQGMTGISIFNIQSAARAEHNLMIFLGVFFYGFITLISLICIANIFNTVSTNIALRRKEFAMLRSVGMTPKGFNKMIRFESIFYGLKGLLYGLPISICIAFLLNNMQQSVLETGFTLPWASYGFGILMILIIVFATMLYSTSRIKKENIIDALKEENM